MSRVRGDGGLVGGGPITGGAVAPHRGGAGPTSELVLWVIVGLRPGLETGNVEQ